jgi:hypothetical protein
VAYDTTGGATPTLGLLVLNDNVAAPAAGNARIRAIHAAGGVGTVNVINESAMPPAPLFSNLLFGTASAAAEVPAGQYNVGLDTNNNNTSELRYALPTLPAGASANAFAYINGGAAQIFVQVLGASNALDRSLRSYLASISGSLAAGDTTFVRPTATCTASTITSPEGTYYDVIPFTNTGAAPINIEVVASWPSPLDGFLHLYSAVPVAATPLVGCITGDDDEVIGSAAGARGSRVTRTLAPGETVQIVASAYNKITNMDAVGPYTITVNQLP